MFYFKLSGYQIPSFQEKNILTKFNEIIAIHYIFLFAKPFKECCFNLLDRVRTGNYQALYKVKNKKLNNDFF